MHSTPDHRLATLLLAAALTLFLPTTTHAATPTTAIHITDQGLQPVAAAVELAAPVVWHNDTAIPVRLADQPFAADNAPTVYLPSVATSSGNPITATFTELAAVPVHWISDPIAAGHVFTRTYTTPGEHHFFVDGLPGITGTVTVLDHLPLVPGVDEVLIPAGSFQMGCDAGNDPNCMNNELPLHTITLDAYVIDKHEVTNARYQTCVDAGICTPPGVTTSFTRDEYFGNPTYADYPVIHVDWRQAWVFCAWADKRLPTEAEWEKAARGSMDTRPRTWGDQPPTCEHANWWGESLGCIGDTSPVGSYPAGASPFGVLDMAGNVWEWVNDWYAADSYAQSPTDNPPGPQAGTHRVARGGSWLDMDRGYVLRVAFRFWINPDYQGLSTGFRCARSR